MVVNIFSEYVNNRFFHYIVFLHVCSFLALLCPVILGHSCIFNLGQVSQICKIISFMCFPVSKMYCFLPFLPLPPHWCVWFLQILLCHFNRTLKGKKCWCICFISIFTSNICLFKWKHLYCCYFKPEVEFNSKF